MILVKLSISYIYRIIVSNTSLKLGALGHISVVECLRESSTTFTQCAPEAAEFGEITQNMGHFAVQSFKVADFGTNRNLHDFLLVISTNLLPIILLQFLRYSIPNVKNRYIWLHRCVYYLYPPTEGFPYFPWDDLRTIFRECQRWSSTKWCWNTAENFNPLSRAEECYKWQTTNSQTTDRQSLIDGRAIVDPQSEIWKKSDG